MPYPFQVTNRFDGTVVTAAIYKTDRQEIADAMIPTNIDDYSASAAQMQTATDPGGEGTESRATTLAGEIERLRFKLKQVLQYFNNGAAINYWYSAVAGILGVANGGTGSSTAAGARANLNAVGRDGDSRGSALSIGTTDNFGVNLITNNAARVTISNAGIATFNHQVKAKSGAGGVLNPNDCGVVFSGDNDTGLFNPADGQLEAYVNGTRQWNLDGTHFGVDIGRILFPTTQNASANANALDDYEEGTWTPAWGRTVTDPTVTYTEQTGRYTKIGRLVLASFTINISSVTAQGSGSLRVTGFPFAIGGGGLFDGLGRFQGGAAMGGENNFYLEGGGTVAHLYKSNGADYADSLPALRFGGFLIYETNT